MDLIHKSSEFDFGITLILLWNQVKFDYEITLILLWNQVNLILKLTEFVLETSEDLLQYEVVRAFELSKHFLIHIFPIFRQHVL